MRSISFFLSLVIGLMSGVSVVVAQYFGFQDFQRLKRVLATASIMIVSVSVALTIVGILLAKPLLLLLGTPTEILDDSVLFVTTLFIGILPMGLYNGVSAILRAFGNSITPLYFLIISSLLNIALSFLFVVGLDMGVAGAAWATVLSQLVSAILCIIYSYRKIPYMRLKKKDIHFDRAIFKEIFSNCVSFCFTRVVYFNRKYGDSRLD